MSKLSFLLPLLLFALLAGCEPQPDPEKERLKKQLQDAQDQSSTRGFFLVVAVGVGVGIVWYLATHRTVVNKQVVTRTPAHALVSDSFAIDGLNVVRGSQDGQAPSLRYLLTILVVLGKRNSTFKCFFDANTYHVLKNAGCSDEATAYRALLQEFGAAFVEVRGDQADPYILDYAHANGTPIISNDFYREFVPSYSWLQTNGRPNKERVVPFVVHPDMIQLLAIGIHEPLLTNIQDALVSLREILSAQISLRRR